MAGLLQQGIKPLISARLGREEQLKGNCVTGLCGKGGGESQGMRVGNIFVSTQQMMGGL